MGTNNRSRARLLKLILSSELDLELLLSHRMKLACFAPNVFFHRNYSLPERLKYRALKEEIQRRSNPDEASLSMLFLNLYHVVFPVTSILIPPWNLQNFYLSGK